jgi:hypothetical protein
MSRCFEALQRNICCLVRAHSRGRGDWRPLKREPRDRANALQRQL